MLSFGLMLNSDKEYIEFFISLLQGLIVAGVVLRVIYILLRIQNDENISSAKIIKKISNPIIATIIALTISEIIRFIVARYYGYFY